jgi:hypothetical protein
MIPGGDHTGCPAPGRNPDSGSDIPEVRGPLEEDHRPGRGICQEVVEVILPPPRQGDHFGPMRMRRELFEKTGLNFHRQLIEPLAYIGSQCLCKLPQFRETGADNQIDPGSEPDGVLDGVKPLQHRQGGITSGCLEAGSEL